MTVMHKPWNFIAGDDWMLNVQLVDSENKPYNTQEIEIRWLLHNPNGEIVPHDYVIQHQDAANGKITVWIPAAVTTDFGDGAWTDWIRIVCNGIVSTLLYGSISVTADPWRAEIAAEPRTFQQSIGDVVVMLHEERITRTPRRTSPKPAVAEVVQAIGRRGRHEGPKYGT